LASAGSSFIATASVGAWRVAAAGSDAAVGVAVVVVVVVAFEVVFEVEVALDVVAPASSASAAQMGAAIIGRP